MNHWLINDEKKISSHRGWLTLGLYCTWNPIFPPFFFLINMHLPCRHWSVILHFSLARLICYYAPSSWKVTWEEPDWAVGIFMSISHTEGDSSLLFDLMRRLTGDCVAVLSLTARLCDPCDLSSHLVAIDSLLLMCSYELRTPSLEPQ